LGKRFEVFLAAEMLQVGVVDREIRCEHGGGDFVAVGAVADEAAD
jgi:hypothetical protein